MNKEVSVVIVTIVVWISYASALAKSRSGPSPNVVRFTPSTYPWRYYSPLGPLLTANEPGDLSSSYNYRSSRSTEDRNKTGAGQRKREVSYWSSYYNYAQCEFTCDDGTCLKNEQRCDGYAQCWDGTDEKGCTCKNFIGEEKICDGYKDCPDGQDEHGCVYGCQSTEYTCDLYATGSRVKCIPMSQRCDGHADCPLENDEHDCYRMVDLHEETRGYRSHGILQKRVAHSWHTICKTTGSHQYVQAFAQKACKHASGFTNGAIKISTVSLSQQKKKMTQQQIKDLKYVGMAELEKEFATLGTCASDYAYEVECPSPQCGGLGNQEEQRRRRKRSTDDEDLLDDADLDLDDVNEEEEGDMELVVGGYATKENSWPFLVGIFRDGDFYCGGSIVNDRWILTAAHCSHNYDKHTYEVQAGMTRRYSWSPYEQTRHVEEIYVHEGYDSKVFANDIALYKLDKPLYLSKYVTPACLPEGYDDDPQAGQYCKVAGWGDLSESGSGPDHMQEVSLPILANCVETFTRDEYQICAGYSEGGKDACQGDSGGPLLCTNSAGRPIVNGVVSFGRGCARANEAGAYTRVSAYLNWIAKIVGGEYTQNSYYPRPKQCTEKCHKPAGECMYPEEKCSGKVECLDALDELGCTHLITRAHQAQSPSTYETLSPYYTMFAPYQYPSPQTSMYQGIGMSRSASTSSANPPRAYRPLKSSYRNSQDGPGYRAGQPISHSVIANAINARKKASRTTVLDCGNTEWQCATAKTGGLKECIAASNFCDGTVQCSDSSDEASCVAVTMDFSEPLHPSPLITDKEIQGYIITRVGSPNWHFLTTDKWSLAQGQAVCSGLTDSEPSTFTLKSLETIEMTELIQRVPSAAHLLNDESAVIKANANQVFAGSQQNSLDSQNQPGLLVTKENLQTTLNNANGNLAGPMIGFVRCSKNQ